MKYLTLTIVFEGENLNYGESFGNVLSLSTKLPNRFQNYDDIPILANRGDPDHSRKVQLRVLHEE